MTEIKTDNIQIALVTGASGGIGSAIAYALAKQGARLALSGSNGDKLRICREQLNDEGGGDHVEITCNLSDSESVGIESIIGVRSKTGSMNQRISSPSRTELASLRPICAAIT